MGPSRPLARIGSALSSAMPKRSFALSALLGAALTGSRDARGSELGDQSAGSRPEPAYPFELGGGAAYATAPIRGGVIEKETTAALIDEIPVLAVLGATSENGLTIRDAGELRVKETDRIATVVENFRRMGIEVQASPDGLVVPGRQRFRSAAFDSFGDHRIAMAFAVAALRGDGESTIDNADSASVSFPGFFSILRQVSLAAGPVQWA